MRCYDLFKLSSMKQLEIAAGSENLANPIRWIYFADTIDIDDYTNWIEGHELIIVTGRNFSHHPELMIPILSKLKEKEIAGILFNLGNFIKVLPDTLVKEASRLHIPLFTLPWSAKLINVSREICNQIILDERKGFSENNFLDKILFNPNLSTAELTQIILDTNFDFKKPCRLGVIQYRTNDTSSDHNMQVSLDPVLIHSFRNEIISHKYDLSFTLHGGLLIFIASSELIESKGFQRALTALFTFLQPKFPDTLFNCGIGRAYEQPYDYKKSYREALKVSSAMISAKANEFISFYDHADISKLLSYMEDKELLKEFYYSKLTPLLAYDSTHDSNLINTLWEFLHNDLDLNITADKLFLHKNTLRYRINRIEEILNCSLENIDAVLDLKIAEKIGQLFQLI